MKSDQAKSTRSTACPAPALTLPRQGIDELTLQPVLAGSTLGFSDSVSPNGYRWWYVDAFSECGRSGLTLILFVGSVFSPYYHWARRFGAADPENFCSINAIFYGPDRHRWAMTERGRADVSRGADFFCVGPSHATFDDNTLTIEINERCTPWPSPLRGRVQVRVDTWNERCIGLDAGGQHRWWPVVPSAGVEVALADPDLTWWGHGYVDSNGGAVPLEKTFREWHWLRTAPGASGGEIHYDLTELSGQERALTVPFDSTGRTGPFCEESIEARQSLPRAPIWRVGRTARNADSVIRVDTLEDTPFYARSELALDRDGTRVKAMHESLDLRRFNSAWVQTLLPFRMPRRAGGPPKR